MAFLYIGPENHASIVDEVHMPMSLSIKLLSHSLSHFVVECFIIYY